MTYGIVGVSVFFFNDTATTEIYTLSLHDALPISTSRRRPWASRGTTPRASSSPSTSSTGSSSGTRSRSEEHTSELQSQSNLVCRLLLEKKKPTRPIWKQHAIHRSSYRSYPY